MSIANIKLLNKKLQVLFLFNYYGISVQTLIKEFVFRCWLIPEIQFITPTLQQNNIGAQANQTTASGFIPSVVVIFLNFETSTLFKLFVIM